MGINNLSRKNRVRTSLLLLGLLFGVSRATVGVKDVGEDPPISHRTVIEGESPTLPCNVTLSTGQWVDWETPTRGNIHMTNLTISYVKRNDFGIYTCFLYSPRVGPRKIIGSVYLDVLYPGTISSLYVEKHYLNVRELYYMNFTVEGNPNPNTTFTSEKDGKIIKHYYNEEERASYNVTMNVSCNSTGIYRLETHNNIGNAIRYTNITVLQKPLPSPFDPNPNRTQFPRLSDHVTFTQESGGCPPPTFTWLHKGKDVNHTDSTYTSEVNIYSMTVDDFGTYAVDVRNPSGNFSTAFNLIPHGRPQSPSDFRVVNVGATNATLSWTSGYDYSQQQTFVILIDNDTTSSYFREIPDTTSGRGNEKVTYELTELEQYIVYNLSILSRNGKGESAIAAENVTVSTLGKPSVDPKQPVQFTYKPRLGESVVLTMNAIGMPPPAYTWLHKGNVVPSSDTKYTSKLTINHTEVDDFGSYTLTIRNVIGQASYVYNVRAEGPPAPVTHLELCNLTLSSANISWDSGYDYNNTQTFYIYRVERKGNLTEVGHVADTPHDPGQGKREYLLDFLEPDRQYNITVMSRNAHGTSGNNASEFLSFVTYGKPKPDPSYPVTNSSTPRLGQSEVFQMKAIANPIPTYSWWFKTSSLNHTDANLTTSMSITNVQVANFGVYKLTMSNVYGNFTYKYLLEANGPPGEVTDLSVSGVSEDSANITFTAGFNYDNDQTFTFVTSNQNKWTVLKNDIKDQTDGTGKQVQFYVLDQLQSSTTYTLRMYSTNIRGDSNSSTTVKFTTKESKQSGSSPNTAEVAGIVTGGIALVLFVVAVVVLYKWSKNRKRVYVSMEEDEQQQLPEPHTYRYDDASMLTD